MNLPARVAILRFSALGDVAMTIPVVYSAASSFPGVQFRYFTRRKFLPLFVNAPSNLEVEGVDDAGVMPSAFLLSRLVGAFRPDAVTDLHNVGRTWRVDTLLRLRGVRVAMVDKGRRRRRKALRDKQPMKPFFECYREVFASLGLDFTVTFRSIFPDGVESPVALTHPAVGIAPFARYATKTYPLPLMESLCRRLAKSGANLYFFGGGERERSILEEWEEAIPGSRSLVGLLTLRGEMEVMANLDAMVSMDSANQHLASLCATPVYTLWGGTAPLCGFSPWGQDPARSFRPSVDCHPCSIAGSVRCARGDFRCFKSLSVEKMAETILKNLCPDG